MNDNEVAVIDLMIYSSDYLASALRSIVQHDGDSLEHHANAIGRIVERDENVINAHNILFDFYDRLSSRELCLCVRLLLLDAMWFKLSC